VRDTLALRQTRAWRQTRALRQARAGRQKLHTDAPQDAPGRSLPHSQSLEVATQPRVKSALWLADPHRGRTFVRAVTQ
jgi:hypothetical protein